MSALFEQIRRRPWLLVVAALVLFLAASAVSVAIAVANPPAMVR